MQEANLVTHPLERCWVVTIKRISVRLSVCLVPHNVFSSFGFLSHGLPRVYSNSWSTRANSPRVHRHNPRLHVRMRLPAARRPDSAPSTRAVPRPEAKPRYVPAIGPLYLTYYFLHPDCFRPTQRFIYNQLPKRRRAGSCWPRERGWSSSGASTSRRAGTGSRLVFYGLSCCWPREAACLGLRGLTPGGTSRGVLRCLACG